MQGGVLLAAGAACPCTRRRRRQRGAERHTQTEGHVKDILITAVVSIRRGQFLAVLETHAVTLNADLPVPGVRRPAVIGDLDPITLPADYRHWGVHARVLKHGEEPASARPRGFADCQGPVLLPEGAGHQVAWEATVIFQISYFETIAARKIKPIAAPPTDLRDLAAFHGREVVRHRIVNAVAPTCIGWVEGLAIVRRHVLFTKKIPTGDVEGTRPARRRWFSAPIARISADPDQVALAVLSQ